MLARETSSNDPSSGNLDRWEALGIDETKPALGARLIELGVPAHVAAYLEHLKPQAWIWWVSQSALLPLMVAGIAVGGLWLWPGLEALTEANALAAGQRAGALMVQYNFGMSLVLALFGWIFASGAIVGIATIATERTRASTFAFGILNTRQAVARWALQRTLRRLSNEANPETYVRRAVVNWQWWMAGSAAILLAISAYAVSRDVQAHGIYTRSHFIDSPFFPWGSRTPTPWADAVKVELGCNHVTGRNAYDSLIYRVHFPGRYFVSLESGVAFGDWLDAAEEIDAELRSSGAEFRRWNWLDRDPLDPACLNVMRRSFEQDYPRIERLLRIGELPDR